MDQQCQLRLSKNRRIQDVFCASVAVHKHKNTAFKALHEEKEARSRLAYYLKNFLVLNDNLQLLCLLTDDGSSLKLVLMLHHVDDDIRLALVVAVHLLSISKSFHAESNDGVTT